jgi:RimJ/RimL family protein N-acetyltransferase
MPKRIASKRLMLRPFCVDDIPIFAKMSSDPAVMRYVTRGSQSFTEISDTVAYFLEHLKQYDYGVTALIDKQLKTLIGFSGFNHHSFEGKEYVELGYRILPEYWGQGYATEAAQALVHYAFTDLKLPELISIIHPQNIASLRVSSKIGMKLMLTTEYQDMPSEIYYLKNPSLT